MYVPLKGCFIDLNPFGASAKKTGHPIVSRVKPFIAAVSRPSSRDLLVRKGSSASSLSTAIPEKSVSHTKGFPPNSLILSATFLT